MLQDTSQYEASLVEASAATDKTVLVTWQFNIAELIMSKGQFVFKEEKPNLLGNQHNASATDNGKVEMGVIAHESREEEEQTLEFSLQITRIPRKPKREACFFLIHKQVSPNEFEVVYESEFQHLNQNGLTFDVASIPKKSLIVDQPKFTCQLQLLTLKKKGIVDRESAV